MPRYKLTVEYDGTPFVGWQRQHNGPSVQAAIEDAVLAFCGETVVVRAAGRTDAGVHALGQVVHVDIARPTPADKVRDALNAHLRDVPVAVLSAERVADDFHARFHATGRRYLYRIVNRRAPLALEANRAWLLHVPLDVARMRAAAAILVGHHDFTSFRSTRCQAKSPVRTLERMDVSQSGEEIRIELAARSFLHNQVRVMVGTLRLVGEGSWSPDDVARALAARDRAAGGPTAPPHGLYLTRVLYEGDSDGRDDAQAEDAMDEGGE